MVRTALKLTQEQFGRPFKLNQANIRDLEAGKVKMSQLHLFSFEKVFNINPDWLLSGNGEMIFGNETNSSALQKYDSLNEELLQLIVEAIADYLESTKSYLLSSPSQKAKVYTVLYNELRDEKKVSKKEILRILKIAETWGLVECGVTSQKNT